MSERLRGRSRKPIKLLYSSQGSNPCSPAINNYAQIAQSVEQGTENPCVRGSIPRLGTTKLIED